MSSNITNEDSRSRKTERTLYAALVSLLKNHSFKKITIKGICEDALISRAAFYAHFIDKYDLLERWITEYWPKNLSSSDSYEQMEEIINRFINKNITILENLISDADEETISIFFDHILSTINLVSERNSNKEMHPKNVVLSHFYAGGVISYFMWQIKNKLPSNVPPMNEYFYKMIKELKDWQSI